jgi:uncharacterized protein YbaA (DUF1428 family)
MERSVDGFVLVVPTDDRDAYMDLTARAGTLWMDHGALEYVAPDMGDESIRQFPEMADAGPDPSVVFASIRLKF